MVMLVRLLPPPVPSMVRDEFAVASAAQVIRPPVFPKPILRVLASSVLVPEPRVRVERPPSLPDWLSPTSISEALMKLLGATDATVVSANARMPALLVPMPTATVPVVLMLTLLRPDRSAVVVSLPPELLLGCATRKLPEPATASEPPPVA